MGNKLKTKKIEIYGVAKKCLKCNMITLHVKGKCQECPNALKENNFYNELRNLINRYSKENESDTPDFILAEYLVDCLNVFTKSIIRRDYHYGKGATK